jgi:cytochrome c
MKTRNLLVLSLLAALYGVSAVAAEPAVASGAEKAAPVAGKAAPAAKPKVKKHKKDCVEKDGKPCHLSKPVDAASKRAEPAAQAKAPPDIIKAAVPAAVAAPVAAAKPEAKAEAVLPEKDALRLAQQSGCLVCHAIGGKVVGPAWKDVAAKYRGDAGAEAKLIAAVSKGGKGVWGSMAMPANSPRVSDANIKSLVRFVLSLK